MSNLELLVAMIDKTIKLSEQRKKYQAKPRPIVRKEIWRKESVKPVVTSATTHALCGLGFLRGSHAE